jgi:hypothetical protein
MNRAVQDQHEIRGELVAIALNRRDQARRAGLFFSVEDHLDVRGEGNGRSVEGIDRRHQREDR